MSTMFRVRVPAGTRSGRCRRRGVLGKANEAPLISPPPATPNFPARAGSAKTARMPLPPFWLRSRPLPTLMAAGEMCWYQSTSWRIAVLRHAAHPRRLGQADGARRRHVLLEARHVALDERAVERVAPLQLRGHRPGQHHVGARPDGQVEVGLGGDLRAARIDHHQLGSRAARAADDRREVQVRPGDVVAPRDDEPGVDGLLGGHPRRGTERPHPGLGPHAAAEGLAIEQARARAGGRSAGPWSRRRACRAGPA